MGEINNFDILKEINQDDIDNGTGNIQIGNTFIGGRKTKQGDELTFGVAHGALMGLMTDKLMAVVVLIDKKAYKAKLEEHEKRNNEK